MTDTFTASNGITVTCRDWNRYDLISKEGDDMLADTPWLSRRDMDALREYFAAERDRELGRWRWPADLDYVVHQFAPRNARVLRESVGKSLDYMDEGAWPSAPSDYSSAARAFFEAHPEPKPAWHDAKPGEVWVLSYGDEKVPAVVSSSESGHFLFTAATNDAGGTEELSLTNALITAARRIWPTEVSNG